MLVRSFCNKIYELCKKFKSHLNKLAEFECIYFIRVNTCQDDDLITTIVNAII